MRVKVIHHIDDLADDLRAIAVKAPGDLKAAVRQGAIVGNTVAKDNARRSSGRHGKLYPRSFTWETSSFVGFGGASYTAEYGPDIARPQGGMSFEFGSRNQKPHLDLAKSADLVGPALAGEVRDKIDGWFW